MEPFNMNNHFEREVIDHLDLPTSSDITTNDLSNFRWPMQKAANVYQIFGKRVPSTRTDYNIVEIEDLPMIIGSQSKEQAVDWSVMRFNLSFQKDGKIHVVYDGYENNRPTSFMANIGINLVDSIKHYRENQTPLHIGMNNGHELIVYATRGGHYWICKKIGAEF